MPFFVCSSLFLCFPPGDICCTRRVVPRQIVIRPRKGNRLIGWDYITPNKKGPGLSGRDWEVVPPVTAAAAYQVILQRLMSFLMGKERSKRFQHIGTWSPLFLGGMCLFHFFDRWRYLYEKKITRRADETATAEVDALRHFLEQTECNFCLVRI